MFLGEEYGWRAFLQTILQKQLEKKKGIVLTGIIWGVWHFPLVIYYYMPKNWVKGTAIQVIGCVALGIFWGYTYMNTKNIWVPIVLYWINNSFGTIMNEGGVYANIEWRNLLVHLCVMAGVFGIVIFAPIFHTKESTLA